MIKEMANPELNSFSKPERGTWIIFSLLAALSLALRIFRINQGLWYDEIDTLLKFVRSDWLKIMTSVPVPNNHILYTILAKVSITLFGEREWSLRLPALIAGARPLSSNDLAGRLVVVSHPGSWSPSNLEMIRRECRKEKIWPSAGYRENGSWRWLVVCGIFSGGALAEKYTALAVIAANGLLIFFWAQKQRLAKTAFYFCLSCCFLLPWFAKNLVLVGNPFFPFLTQIFDGPGWDQELFSKYIYGLRFDGMGRRWFDYPALFYRLFLFGSEETTRFDARFNPVLLFLSPIYFFFFRKKQELWIWAWFLIVFIFWAAGSQQGRFLIPGIAALALISGAAFEKIQEKAGKYLGLAAALLVLFISVIYLPARVFKVGDDLNFISGRKSLEKYLVDHENRFGLMRIDELLEINRVTPADARLFLLMENRGFYLERDYLADSAFVASYTKQMMVNLGSADSFYAWLKRNHFSYIYNVDLQAWKQGAYLEPETRLEYDRADSIYQDFVKKYGELVFRRQGELVRVK